jgi:hypothetical protein
MAEERSGYAGSRKARRPTEVQAPVQQARTAGASAASPLQELSQIPTSLQDDQGPRTSPAMPSSRDALPGAGMSLRDRLSSPEGLASWNALPSRESTSLRDSSLSRAPLPSPASRFKGGPISRAGFRRVLDGVVDLGLSRWEAPASASGPASAADRWWRPRKRSPEVFEGDAALKELRSRLAADPADQGLEPPLPPAKTPIFAPTAFRVVVLAAGGALGFLYVTPANQQVGEEVASVSLRETLTPAAENVADERAPDPATAAEQAAAGAALYDDFLKWRQLQLRKR